MNSSLKFLNFSPSTKSSLNTPLAESTAIGSPISRQSHQMGNSKRRTVSPLNNPSKMRSAVKIDPHVLTDAQSSGIVSRLVKYYDHSTSEHPERSRIVYNKFGDYPIVHLKKTEIKRPIMRSTSVRIAPPSKSIMNPTIRAAIMRSNSFSSGNNGSGAPKILPTKMRAKDDSHQIIRNHEPIIDSVSSNNPLDALEKNCRKRINNEELILDRTKKFCGPPVPPPSSSLLLHQQQQQSTSEIDSPAREFIPISPPLSSAKRTRDISPARGASMLLNENSQPSKKFKTRNNALLSSLSSSHYQLIPYNNSSVTQTTHQENPLKRQSSFDFVHQSSSSSKMAKSKALSMETEEEEPLSNEAEVARTKSQETLPSQAVARSSEIAETQPAVARAESQKKLHLFNRKPDPNAMLNRAKLRAIGNKDNDNDDDDDDDVKIRFVKPKAAVIENFETVGHTGKLSKMLNNLSTGFRSPPFRATPTTTTTTQDTVDTATKEKNSEGEIKKSTSAASISFVTSTTPSTIAPISSPSTSSVISVSATQSFKLPEVTRSEGASVSAASITLNATSSSTTTPIAAFGATSTAISTAQLPKPALGGFQFGSSSLSASKDLISFTPKTTSSSDSSLAVAASTVTATTASSVEPSKPLISFTPIAKATNAEFASTTTATTAAASILPTFGSVSSTASSTGGFKFGASEAPKQANATSSGFNFGGSSSLANNVSATTNPSTAADSPQMMFGTNAPKLPSTTASSLTSTLLPAISTQAPMFNFQNTTTSAPTNTLSSGGFAFGSSTTAPSAAPAVATQGISFGGSSISGIAPLSNSSPSFGKPETTVASGVGFSFGGSKPAMTFGGGSINPVAPTTAASATPPSAFAFGGQASAAAPPPPAYSMPTATTTSAALGPTSSFSFGSSASTPSAGSAFTGFGVQKTESQPVAGIFAFNQQKPQESPLSTTSNNASPASGAFNFGGSTAAPQQSPSASGFNFGKPALNAPKPGGIFSRLGDKLPATNEVKPFSFNADARQSAAVNAFGGQSATTSAPMFGQPAAAPVFGQNSIVGSNSNNLFSQSNQSAQSVFGGGISQQPQQQQQQQQPSGMFSFNAQSNEVAKTSQFNFGSAGAGQNNALSGISSSTTSIFGGGASSTNSSPNVSASFTFNRATGGITSNASGQNMFGQAQSSAPTGGPSSGFQFGANSNNNQNNNVSASFTFSGAASAPTPQSNNASAFNFGGASSASAAQSGAFNFQAQAQQQQQQQQNAAGGVFSIGTGGNQNQRRLIRTASRRFK